MATLSQSVQHPNWGSFVYSSRPIEIMMFRSASTCSILFAAVVSTVLPAAQSQPSDQSLTVTVQPAKPILGDTIAIAVQSNTVPTVQVDGKSFSSFSIGGNRWRTFVPTTPLQAGGRRSLVVKSGSETRNMVLWVGDRKFPVQSIWLPPSKDKNVSEMEFDRMDAFKATVTPQKFWQGTFRRPNAGPQTTGYGVRRYYNGVFAKDYYHRGLDYAGPTGSPVLAAAAGKIGIVGFESQGFLVHGNVVGIDHGQGVLTVYLHLSKVKVKQGELVQAGQVIGAVGSTGAATGPHLHWGLYVGGQSVNPKSWLSQGWE
jgi:murein DD-endopeptidase MepM/ murein hydrolase activator NlpD